MRGTAMAQCHKVNIVINVNNAENRKAKRSFLFFLMGFSQLN